MCWCVFWKIWKEKESDIKKGWKGQRRKLTMTILNRWEEVVLLWKQVYADTLPEVQRSSRVIPQLAEFLVILPSKRKHRRVSNRIKLRSHRCFFWKGHNWSRCQQRLLIQRLIFQCLFSPWSCLPILLWIHPSLAWAPWGVLISNHYLMTEICRQKTRRHTVP